MRAAQTIAVIDDDDSLRDSLVGFLRSSGFRSQGYASAEQFLARIDREHTDCIVSDVHMPGLSGIEMTEKLRAAGDNLPVIMISARSGAALQKLAAASGAAALLTKPFDVNQLVDLIAAAIGGGNDAPAEEC